MENVRFVMMLVRRIDSENGGCAIDGEGRPNGPLKYLAGRLESGPYRGPHLLASTSKSRIGCSTRSIFLAPRQYFGSLLMPVLARRIGFHWYGGLAPSWTNQKKKP